MKKLFALLLALCMVFALAACGEEPAPEGTGAPSTGEPSGEPVEAELNIMMSFPQFMDQWETYCDQFEQKMLEEENIKLTINLEMPSSGDYESVLQTRLTGDDAPDLFTLHSNNIATYYEAGHLTDLSNEPLAEKIYENVADMVTYDGKLLAVPIESQAWGPLYNKAIFEECGLEPPETLDELRNVVEVLEENGYTPFMLAFQEQWVPQLITALTLGGEVSGNLTDWVERMNAGEGSYTEMAEIFEVIDLIMEHGTDRAMETGAEAGAAAFANGEAAMFVQGTWASGTIMSTNPDMELGVFALPVNNDVGCTNINLSVSTTLAVHPSSDQMDLALKFVNYVLDDEDSNALFEACSFNPLATCHTFEPASWVADANVYVEAGRSYKDLVLPTAVTDEQGRLLQEYYVGSVTADEMMARLDEVYAQAVSAAA